jgi:hypothetical protein
MQRIAMLPSPEADFTSALYAASCVSIRELTVGSFEPLFFGNLLLGLECCFVHRARGIGSRKRSLSGSC